MNKFVELSPEFNFHANWHVSSSLVTFVFDSIYLCTLMRAFFISTGMSGISIACNWTLSDPFRELGSWFVELWVAGVGEVSMFLLTLLVAAIIIPMIRSTLTNSKAKHVLDFLNLKQEVVFCLSLEAIYPIFSSGNTPCSIKSLLCEVAGHGRIKIWSTIINNHPGIDIYVYDPHQVSRNILPCNKLRDCCHTLWRYPYGRKVHHERSGDRAGGRVWVSSLLSRER